MFYYNVKELCRLHKTNITTLMKELDLSTSLPTKWKAGSNPNIETVQKIADYFGVTADVLLRNRTSLNTALDVVDSVVLQGVTGSTIIGGQKEKLSDMESEVLRVFRSLDMRTKNKVMSYLYDIEDNMKGGE